LQAAYEKLKSDFTDLSKEFETLVRIPHIQEQKIIE
jgi:hypothetical protein